MDVSADRTIKTTSEPKVMTWTNDTLWLHSIVRETRSYNIENLSGQARQTAVEIVLPSNSRLVSPKDSLAGGSGEHYVLFSVPARNEMGTTVVIEKGIQTQIPLNTTSLRPYRNNPSVPEAARGPIEDAWTLVSKIEVLQIEINQGTMNMQELQTRSARVKEDLRAIPQGAAGGKAVQQMVQDLNRLEASIRRIEESAKAKNKEIEELTAKLDGVMKPLTPNH